MECLLCGHPSAHKHGKAPNGSQRYYCPQCKHSRFNTTAAQRAGLSESA